MRFRVDYGIIYYMILGGWPGQQGGPRFGVANRKLVVRPWVIDALQQLALKARQLVVGIGQKQCNAGVIPLSASRPL